MILKRFNLFIFLVSLFFNTVSAQKEIEENSTGFFQILNTKSKGFKKLRLSADFKLIPSSRDAYVSLWLRESFKRNDSIVEGDLKYDFKQNTKWENQKLILNLNETSEEVFFGGFIVDFGDFYFKDFKLEAYKNNEWINIKIDNASFEKGALVDWKEGVDREGFRSVYYDYKTINTQKEKALFISGELPEVNLYADIKVDSKKINENNEAILINDISVINVETGKIKVQDVLIFDKKIESIKSNIKSKDEYKVISGTGKFLIPGLVDSHIHLFQSGGLYTRPDAIDLTKFRSYDNERKWVKRYAADILKRYLRCGITTVIDVGGPLVNFEIRDKYNDYTEYPNLFLTGPLISTYQPEAFKINDPPIIKVNTPEEARELVRKQIPYKPDFIKIWYIKLSDDEDENNFEIVKATIDESHKNNLKVAVHATELETAKKALIANADILVHSIRDEKVDKELIDLLKKNSAKYIPTFIVNDNYTNAFGQKLNPSLEDFNISNPIPLGSLYDSKRIELKYLFKPYLSYAKRSFKPDSIIRAISNYNVRELLRNNVVVATGTDAGNIGTLHATSFYDEISAMKKAGITNFEILKASTLSGAKVLSKEDIFGSVTEGKMADLVILNSNPLSDINALKDIEYVIKSGSIYEVDDIIKDSPEILVQRQVNGYNARNIDAFLEPYADDFEVYGYPNELEGKSKDNLREIYINFFEKYPELHCEIVSRMVLGNKVIDHERITGISFIPYEAIAIYEIEDGKIKKVTFVREN